MAMTQASVSSANPLMVAENITGLLTFILLIAAVIGLVTHWLDRRRKDDVAENRRLNQTAKEHHESDHRLLDQTLGEMRHKSNNHAQKLAILEQRDGEKELRLAKVEMSIQNFEKAQLATQHMVENIGKEQDNQFKMLAESIREIRAVSPRKRR